MKIENYQTVRSIETVTHPFFGKGKVLQQRWKEQELLVHFDLGITVWVPKRRLSIDSEYQISPAVMEAPPRIGDYEKREMLEAFKLGIVPHKEVLDFTYGREREIETIEKALVSSERRGGGCVIVEGEYGSGKTHFLDYIYLSALHKGFAVCKVEMDPFDVTPYRPRRVYKELIDSFLSREGGFRDLVRRSVKEGLFKDNRFFSHLEEPDEVVWDWIEGETVPRNRLSKKKTTRALPLLPSFSTAADNYCYILSSLGWAQRKLGGKGLVVLIDEAESLFHLWWRTIAIEKGINLIRGLALTSLNRLPDSLGGNIFKDKEIGVVVEEIDGLRVIHRGISSCMTPYIYRKPSGIFLVLAFTPTSASIYESDILQLLEEGVEFLSLGKITQSAYEEMFYKLLKIYRSSFPGIDISAGKVEEIKKSLTRFKEMGVRKFLRATVDALDLIRHYPDIEPERLLRV